jgi:hypothetical protein
MLKRVGWFFALWCAGVAAVAVVAVAIKWMIGG